MAKIDLTGKTITATQGSSSVGNLIDEQGINKEQANSLIIGKPRTFWKTPPKLSLYANDGVYATLDLGASFVLTKLILGTAPGTGRLKIAHSADNVTYTTLTTLNLNENVGYIEHTASFTCRYVRFIKLDPFANPAEISLFGAAAIGSPPVAVSTLALVSKTNFTVTVSWTNTANGAGGNNTSVRLYNGATLVATVSALAAGVSQQYTFTSLLQNTAYTFKVISVDANGTASADSNLLNQTTNNNDITPPTQPAGLTVTSITQTTCTFSWSAAVDNVGVTAYITGGYTGAGNVGNVLTQNITGLTANTSYTFTVKAIDAAGNESTLGSITFQTSAAATPTLENTVKINFGGEYSNNDANANVNNLKVTSGEIATTGKVFATLKDLLTGNATALGITLPASSGFVSAGNSGSPNQSGSLFSNIILSSWWNTQNNNTATFKITGVGSAKRLKITIIHSTNQNATATYTISGSSQALLGQNNIENTVVFLNIAPDGGGEVTVTVQKTGTYYEAGINGMIIEVYSGGIDTTPPPALSGVTAGSPSQTTIDLGWTEPTGNTGYEIRYSNSTITDANFASASLAASPPAPTTAGTTRTFQVTGLLAGRTYYFAIKYKNANNIYSLISNVPSANTSAATPGTVQFITIDKNLTFSELPATLTTQNPFNKENDYVASINPTTFYVPSDIAGDTCPTNAIIVDLGTVWEIREFVLGGIFSANGAANTIQIYAGADWGSPPTDRVAPINWEGSPFASYTGNDVAGYVSITGLTKQTRYLRIFVNGRQNRLGAFLPKGVLIGSAYTPPAMASPVYVEVSKIIGTQGNEGYNDHTCGLITLGSDGGVWRNFTPRYWIDNDGNLGFYPPSTGNQDNNPALLAYDGTDDYDYPLRELNKRGFRSYLCIWTCPDWMQKGSSEHKPNYPNNTDPIYYASYDSQGKIVFQVGARYGNGVVADPKITVKGNNVRLRNKNWSKDYESWNEWTKWWQGRSALFSVYEYFAMMIAELDGNAGAITDAGLKTADSTMRYIVGSSQFLHADVIRAMVFILKRLRPATNPNTVWYAFAGHLYSNPNFIGYPQNSSQYAQAVSPEAYNFQAQAKDCSDTLRALTTNIFYSITEYGYDRNPQSNMTPKLYGSETRHDYLRAIWGVRTVLEVAGVSHVDMILWHQVKHDNYNDITSFNSGGLGEYFQQIGGEQYNLSLQRHLPWWYLANLKSILSKFKFKDDISSGNNNVKVRRFEHTGYAGLYAYALWCPSSNQSTVSYALTLDGGYNTVRLCQHSNTDIAGTKTVPAINSGQVLLTVSEEPQYLIAYNAALPADTHGQVYKKSTLTSGMCNNLVGATDIADIVNAQSESGDPLYLNITQYPINSQALAWENGTEGYLDMGAGFKPVCICILGVNGGDGFVDVSFSNTVGSWTAITEANANARCTDKRWSATYFPLGTVCRYVRIVKPAGLKVRQVVMYGLADSSV